ncbi:MAG: DUF2254 domain-containing protein, partial [Actinobacteria bacterium]|nr:DUF2254 domain-containing protein [Actinomycetota bacterium]
PPCWLPDQTIPSARSGVVVAVDEERLLTLASECDLVIRIVPTIGEFVAEGERVLEVWSDGRDFDDHKLLGCVAFATERTIEQDAAFGFRQIVDIAERALSPGVNDPTTAAQAIDQLHDLLRRLARRQFPSELRADEHGQLRAISPRLSWDDYVGLAFDEIRLYSARSLQVKRRLRGAVTKLLDMAPPARKAALERQLRLLDESAEREFEDDQDRSRARQPANFS